MSAEPDKFYIGVVDLFSILLPGAVLAYLVRSEAGSLKSWLPPGVTDREFSEPEGWALFLFASYLLGHFVFMVGSWLDDWVYDPLRRATPGGTGFQSAGPLRRKCAAWLFKKNADLAVGQASAVRERHLPNVAGEVAVNTFQWAKARLALQCPAGLQQVQRFEADSKFFRSFVIVALLVAVWLAIRIEDGPERWLAPLVVLAVAGLSLLRYIERRFKSTQQAYWYVLVLESTPGGVAVREE